MSTQIDYGGPSLADYTPAKDNLAIASTSTSTSTTTLVELASADEIRETELQLQLEELDIVKEYMAKPEEWSRKVVHAHVTESNRAGHLTAGTLRGPTRLAVSPAMFQSKDCHQMVQVLYLGSGLCGHPGIVHGGLLATLLDELTAWAAIPNLGNAFTANLSVNYRHPTIAEQFIVGHSECTKIEGRKGYVKATLKTLDGTLLADATSLFIAPKVSVSEIKDSLESKRIKLDSSAAATK